MDELSILKLTDLSTKVSRNGKSTGRNLKRDWEALERLNPFAEGFPEQNLGLWRDEKGFHTGAWCGCCWLKDEAGQILRERDGKPVVLSISGRFSSLDPQRMLRMIAGDPEFSSYLCLDQQDSSRRLINFFYSDPLIDAQEGILGDHQLLLALSYVVFLEQTTRRGLIRRMHVRTENYVGKIRGSLLVHRQLSQNVARGRKERMWCRFSEKTADVPENRILKYALDKAEACLRQKHDGKDNNDAGSLADVLRPRILLCRQRLAQVTSVKMGPADVDRVILPAMYNCYRPLLQMAKQILRTVPLDFSEEKQETKGVLPYGVNMPLLFECYVRTLLKKQLAEKNRKLEQEQAPDEGALARITLAPFVADKQGLQQAWNARSGTERDAAGYRPVTEENCYLSGCLVPDLVFCYYNYRKVSDKKNGEELRIAEKPDKIRVYDVKYKDPSRNDTARDDRLQLLAYQFLFQSLELVGLVFPEDPSYLKDQNYNRFTSPDFRCHKLNLEGASDGQGIYLQVPVHNPKNPDKPGCLECLWCPETLNFLCKKNALGELWKTQDDTEEGPG